ncbi:MAG: rRNA ((966)-N(2))-methyltransferase RsmD [Pseudomonadota bacterium]|jgi:16S rRNA (guanine(966)-N(2))-methyltransferase RsmD
MGQVRIIGGIWKRSLLKVVDRPGLRPTPDRVRETLFNWIESWADLPLADSRVCDAFAGTGALAFEAASRGAQQVLALESDSQAADQIRAAIERLCATNLEVRRTDAMAFLAQQPANRFDLIFLDPPFQKNLLGAALAASRACLSPKGLVHVEGERPWTELVDPSQQAGWVERRSAKAGAVHHALLSLEPE